MEFPYGFMVKRGARLHGRHCVMQTGDAVTGICQYIKNKEKKECLRRPKGTAGTGSVEFPLETLFVSMGCFYIFLLGSLSALSEIRVSKRNGSGIAGPGIGALPAGKNSRESRMASAVAAFVKHAASRHAEISSIKKQNEDLYGQHRHSQFPHGDTAHAARFGRTRAGSGD